MPRPTLLTTLVTGAVMVACSGGGGAPGLSTGTEAGGAATDGAGNDATQLDADATSIDGDASGSADAAVDVTADAVDDNRPVDAPASDALASDAPASDASDDGAASDACAPSAPSVACNPPGPAGWVLLPQADVTPAMTSWAVGILNDPTTYPMFAVTTMTFGTVTVLARVEWHPPDFQNSVAHRGVTLYELAG